MPLIFLIVGSALLILDRTIKRATALIYKERLQYFIYYYRPHFHRRHFFGIIIVVIFFSILFNYLIFQKIDLLSPLLILPLIVLLSYTMIFLVTVFDSVVLKKGDIAFDFSMLERDFIQQFSLALFHPVIFLAYFLKNFFLIFTYPSQGIFLFKSLAGLIGCIFLIVGMSLYLL